MIAPNLTPKLIALATYDIVSIITNNGTRPNGVPAGINILKNTNLCWCIPIIVTPINIDTLILNVNTHIIIL